jgi:hypothetical protein
MKNNVSALPVKSASLRSPHRNILRIPRLDHEHQPRDSAVSYKHLMSVTAYMLDPPLSHDHDRIRDLVVAR